MATEKLNRPSPLPSYPEMISKAIEALNRENGSNRTRISTYIESRYGRLPAGHSTLLSHHLSKMTVSGELMFWKNNYYLNGPNAPPRRGPGRPPKDPAIPLSSKKEKVEGQSNGRPPKKLKEVSQFTTKDQYVVKSKDVHHSHLSYPQMISMAIEALNNKNGSNKTSISKYIESRYELPPGQSKLVFFHLNKMKESGELTFWKNNYYRNVPHAPSMHDHGRPVKGSTNSLSSILEKAEKIDEEDEQFRLYLSNCCYESI